MTVSEIVRNVVRQRAHFACEYCGQHERDVSGHLTVDHFQPTSKGGSDDIENLVYSCIWCNQRKLDYWPQDDKSPQLWNPRHTARIEHFFLLDDGILQPLDEIGQFTIRRLRLNRPALIAYRLRQTMLQDQGTLLDYYRSQVNSQNQLINQLTRLIGEQQKLLHEQQQLLAYLRQLL